MEANRHAPPQGLICPLVTPLKTGDVVDEAVYDRLIDHVGSGVDALMIGDPFWGEGLALTTETRFKAFCTVLEIVQGRWPVFMTITSQSGSATRDLMAHSEAFMDCSDYPGEIYWVDYPVYYHSNRGLPQWYAALSEGTHTGFVLGNHAGLIEKRRRPVKHANIRTSVLKKLTEERAIGGLIFTGPLERSMNYRKAVRGRRDFRIYDGEEKAFLSRPSADGVVAGGANLLPRFWQAITRSSLNRYDTHQQFPDHVHQMLESATMLKAFHAVYHRNPAPVMKRMLHVAGILPNAHTASGTGFSTPEENRAVEEVCKKYDLA